jgi:hypothetical protein
MIVDALEESLQTQQSDSSSVTMTLGSTSMLSSPTYARFQVLSDQRRTEVWSGPTGPVSWSDRTVRRGIGCSDRNRPYVRTLERETLFQKPTKQPAGR